MWHRQFCLCLFLAGAVLTAAEYRGQVTFGGLPLPGASITAVQDQKKLTTITDPQGWYTFSDLADGVWTLRVEMQCFSPIQKDVTVASGEAGPEIDLRLLPVQEIQAVAAPLSPTDRQAAFQKTEVNAAKSAPPAPPTETSTPSSETAAELNERAADGFLINGTSNNAATSPFSLASAFGNARKGPGSLYNGNIGIIVDNSVLDARAFSSQVRTRQSPRTVT